MRLRVTEGAPAGLSYPYTENLAPGDAFEVADEKGEALLAAHDYLDSLDHVTDVEYREVNDAEGSLADLTKADLYERAKDADVDGRSEMTKAELIEALE